MRKFQFSFALLVAVVAVGATLLANASELSAKRITGCFRDVRLIGLNEFHATGFLPASYQAADPSRSCTDVKNQITTVGKLWLAVVPSTQEFGCDLQQAKYCCVQFTVQATDPDLNEATKGVQQLTIGAETGYFRIANVSTDVLCRPTNP